MNEISKSKLSKLYKNDKLSSARIAKKLNCSENKINYWLKKFCIRKRTIAEAVYDFHNPNGDPFIVRKPKTLDEAFIFGMGIGLYWGEGNKKNTSSVRLGNTDSRLIKRFIDFLETMYGVDKKRLKFSIQIFADIDPEQALDFWSKEIDISKKQFSKTTITASGKIGTYRKKSEHGVLTLYFNNKKLRDIICSEIEKL